MDEEVLQMRLAYFKFCTLFLFFLFYFIFKLVLVILDVGKFSERAFFRHFGGDFFFSYFNQSKCFRL